MALLTLRLSTKDHNKQYATITAFVCMHCPVLCMTDDSAKLATQMVDADRVVEFC